ncbi:uncharacterized protein LOC122501561 [Leptopilina heterotoma]|uniref:uncharacterized protein LOC122501561 n=1 Tax=Leptopilina heterotoma TaxID=63436 RepID=UPI001CA8C43C|nr:uncharacterized protein LOC122501561 [Leptopilina heterotoma]
MNGKRYSDFLKNYVPRLVRASGIAAGRKYRFMQDGAGIHRSKVALKTLRSLYGKRIIALGTKREWPPRSPDLTPCDFFLWGHVKAHVYSNLLKTKNRYGRE